MTAAALLTGGLIAAGLRTAQLFLVAGVLTAAVALWSCKLLPAGVWAMRPRFLR
jgi:hypothetical protein